MCIIALSLALLAIVAGMMLMAQTKREALGSFFKFVSWFVVIVGFLGIICLGVHCIIRHHHGCMMGKERVGMMDQRGGRCMDARMGGCCNMAMANCCGGMMMRGCNDGMMGCRDGMMNGCNDGKMMKGSNGGMMDKFRDMKCDSNYHMKIKKDSIIIKKK